MISVRSRVDAAAVELLFRKTRFWIRVRITTTTAALVATVMSIVRMTVAVLFGNEGFLHY